MDAPRRLKLETGPVRPVLIVGAERFPAGFGFVIGTLLVASAIYGNWRAIYGLPVVVLWHSLWVLAAKRDPQYAEIMWRSWFVFPWPAWLAAAPGVLAKEVKVEASVPVRG